MSAVGHHAQRHKLQDSISVPSSPPPEDSSKSLQASPRVYVPDDRERSDVAVGARREELGPARRE
eukprot:CAMPEP_0198652124 /NCGR_PEP_ID=MMETSP1467-20131203/6161_1 /TAXON_ID=1462469 /ORGANISM="unid. sp., Strain CCMP2135" /LENGTH=64 /DNA_ID=CAMNT_0044388029 /DNA_START=127 /DNA_END=317 /DNA_ORIENTATION=-